jgi:hypothetical protein
MKNFLKQHSLVWTALAIFLAMALTGWFLVKPLYGQMLGLRDEIQQEHVRQENQQKQIKRLPELKSQYERVIGEEGFFDILLTEDKVVGFIRTLEGLASDTKVEVKIQSNELKVEEGAQRKTRAQNTEEGAVAANEKKEKNLSDLLPYGEYLRLTLTVSGDYSDLAAFLSRLETLPVALDIIGVDVTQPLRDDNSREGDVRAVNPFVIMTEPAQGEENKEGSVSEENIPQELTQPISPKLEAVIDLVVYVDKE